MPESKKEEDAEEVPQEGLGVRRKSFELPTPLSRWEPKRGAQRAGIGKPASALVDKMVEHIVSSSPPVHFYLSLSHPFSPFLILSLALALSLSLSLSLSSFLFFYLPLILLHVCLSLFLSLSFCVVVVVVVVDGRC